MGRFEVNVAGFIFFVSFETIQESTALIPLYFSENSPPMPKSIARNYLMEDLQNILPNKIDKSLKWRREIVPCFWRLLGSHYNKYSRSFLVVLQM